MILVEAGHRCSIPTCRNINVEIHHIDEWAKVKKHEYENLIALCSNCHTMVEKKQIDKKSLLMYKNNLRFIYDRFTPFEIDFLFELYKEKEIQLLPVFELFLKRIIEAGYIDYRENQIHHIAIGAIVLDPVDIVITKKGEKFVKDLSKRNIGY